MPGVSFPSFWAPYLSLPPGITGSTMAHPSVTLLPLSGNRSSSDEPSVLWPYHSTDLPVLTQTTRPAVFTHLFAVSCVFGHQRRPSTHPLLQHSCWCLHTHFSIPHSIHFNLNISVANLYNYFYQRQDSYYKSHES